MKMRIIVPIKQVPETKSVRMDEKTGTVIREGVTAIINPLDLYAIELAVSLKDKHGAEVIAVSMGPAKAQSALKEAVAMGVDSAVLLCDRVFAGSDTWATSYVLAEAAKKLGGYSLVICGERATDGDTGQVGPAIAAWLDLPVLSYVSKVDHLSESSCRVHRFVEDGYDILSCDLPALMTVVKEVCDPRLPTLRGKIKARQMDIPVWDHESLGIEPETVGLNGSPTRVVKIAKPKVTRQCQLHKTGNPEDVASAVEKFYLHLRQKELV